MRPLTGEESELCASLDPIVEAYARSAARRNPSVGYAEFRSAGNLAAVKVVQSWLPEKGPLKAYATSFISKEMRRVAGQTHRTWAREAMCARPAFTLPDDDNAVARDPWVDESVVRAAAVTGLRSRTAGYLVAMFEHAARDAQVDVADRAALEDGRHKSRAIMETQPHPMREVYRLMVLEDKSYTETAAALGLDRSKVQRIAGELKALLAERLASPG